MYNIAPRILRIDVLSLQLQGDALSLRRIATLPNASFTRMIHGTFVGYAVHDNDDTYPYIYDWSTGMSLCLKSQYEVGIQGQLWGPMTDEVVCPMRCILEMHVVTDISLLSSCRDHVLV